MKYACPHCNSEFNLTESGRYECPVCQNKFDFTFPDPSPVKVSQPEPIANRCPFCKLEIPAGAQKCGHCGEWISGKTPVNRTTYLLLSFLFGHFGVHEFYAGNTSTGTIYAFVSLVGLCIGAYHPAGFAIAGILGILQFAIAICSNTGLSQAEINAPKKPVTKGTKIFWWCIYIVIFLLIIVISSLEYIEKWITGY